MGCVRRQVQCAAAPFSKFICRRLRLCFCSGSRISGFGARLRAHTSCAERRKRSKEPEDDRLSFLYLGRCNSEKNGRRGGTQAAKVDNQFWFDQQRKLVSSPLTCKLTNLIRSSARWARSLAWPIGRCTAGAFNSFSSKATAGIEPPSRMLTGRTPHSTSTALARATE